jgi:hypothetical protein
MPRPRDQKEACQHFVRKGGGEIQRPAKVVRVFFALFLSLAMADAAPWVATNMAGLNPHFEEIGWWPDPTATYKCSHHSKGNNFTRLMVLVVSGRDATGRLRRYDELVALLATDTPAQPDASRYSASNSAHWTALMLAARYAGTHSTEETLCLLLAHPAAPRVALLRNSLGSSALSLAVRHHRLDGLNPHDDRFTGRLTSSDTAALMLLDHTSAPALLHRREKARCSILMEDAVNAMWLNYCADDRVRGKLSRTYERIYIAATEQELMQAMGNNSTAMAIMTRHHMSKLQSQVNELQQRLSERATLNQALKEGLSLPGSIALLYV